ncbi:hypothetical protein AQUCO_01300202v1 [Aquilegia coerulea]|uniref:Uncharacterized protein n=1 Tax=Aquilegia coerulea TaxID=218851 RepID=A0A2G5E0C3_AQUCA|nr:hypothetical protein AQUCO_01300202v1 [Aquilegia coerulea]
MGFQINWYTILLIFFVLYSLGESMNTSRSSLDILLKEYAYKSIIQTGILYNATLPSNLSGMEVSVIRLRTRSFWTMGENFSEFHLPQRILPVPFVNRVDIVYQNLGNWSSTYYSVPGYSMVTPVVGFMVYNATDTTSDNISKLNISVMDKPISIQFPQLLLPQGSNLSTVKCVRFVEDGSTELSDMALDSRVCTTHDQGHFSVVVPMPKKAKTKERLWKWLVVGFALGFAGLVLFGLIGFSVFKCVKKKRLAKMEKQADEGVSFENIWIGMSRMPSASVTRTQPVLEHNEVP